MFRSEMNNEVVLFFCRRILYCVLNYTVTECQSGKEQAQSSCQIDEQGEAREPWVMWEIMQWVWMRACSVQVWACRHRTESPCGSLAHWSCHFQVATLSSHQQANQNITGSKEQGICHHKPCGRGNLGVTGLLHGDVASVVGFLVTDSDVYLVPTL